jgi:hypothetical protein
LIQKTGAALSLPWAFFCLWFMMTLLLHLKAGVELAEPLPVFAIMGIAFIAAANLGAPTKTFCVLSRVYQNGYSIYSSL